MNLRLEQYQFTLDESASRLRESSPCPVALRPICRQLGVRGIRRHKLEGARSLLVDASSGPVIILNTSLAGVGRQREKFTKWERFLIAHELGHLVLHQCGVKNPSGRSEYWKLEQLCDAFARRLLIPDHVVTEASDCESPRAIDRLKATLRLVERCSVPWSVTAQRLSDIDDGAVFFRLALMDGGEFKVVVSTRPSHLGIGQRIKPGTHLHQTLSGLFRPTRPHEMETKRLVGIGGIKEIQSGAACSLAGAPRVALISG
jgi:hypothetical protein